MSDRVVRGRSSTVVGLAAGVAVLTLIGLSSPAVGAAGGTLRPAATCGACGHNLIRNAGAEAGKGANADVKVKVPHWKPTKSFTAVLYTWSGGDLTPTTPGPPKRGKSYFYGGPANAKSTGSQTVQVKAGGIKTGNVTYTLSGWLGGFSSQADRALLSVRFETASGTVLSTARIGPVTAAARHDVSELLHRSTTGTVPRGTRKLAIRLVLRRASGSDNDGIADNLSLVFTAPR